MKQLVLALLVACCAVATPALGAETTQRPNVLFVLIDDMGYGDLSCFSDSRVKTDQIDRLGREGVRFSQFYVNAPICSPSRVAFTTGQYPGRWRITSYLDRREMNDRRGIANWLDPAAPSLARMLAGAGYYTAHVGKWHMGGQRDVGDAPLIRDYGFATSLTNFEGLGERVLPKFESDRNGKPFEHVPTKMSADLGGGPIHWIARHEVTHFYVDRALDEINQAAHAGKPFYINLWLDDVHSPCQAPPDLRGDGSPQANYDGVVKEMDRQLGRVFDRIRGEPNLRDNTIILIASDNGPELGLGTTGGMRGSKGNLYEGGIRLPLIVWSPRLLAPDSVGKINGKTLVAAMDFAPSLLALAGVQSSKDIAFDGLDMSQALLGRSAAERSAPVMWCRPPDRPGPKGAWPDLAVRDGNWKLLISRDRSRPELFDIVKDPNERTNLANERPDVTKRLADEVLAWDRSIQESATKKPTSKPAG